jgi:hypothetical protein
MGIHGTQIELSSEMVQWFGEKKKIVVAKCPVGPKDFRVRAYRWANRGAGQADRAPLRGML